MADDRRTVAERVDLQRRIDGLSGGSTLAFLERERIAVALEELLAQCLSGLEPLSLDACADPCPAISCTYCQGVSGSIGETFSNPLS
ncbi:hypothetical protein [Natrononativus amylolyticus]|uniref:hypothetical protein n=1 Tax=Natrononativus amylolyticus TaxID=2963434 RepID=UPI0020CCE9D8|nr:hypothetical protein [Natrononativus amylolyticus]